MRRVHVACALDSCIEKNIVVVAKCLRIAPLCQCASSRWAGYLQTLCFIWIFISQHNTKKYTLWFVNNKVLDLFYYVFMLNVLKISFFLMDKFEVVLGIFFYKQFSFPWNRQYILGKHGIYIQNYEHLIIILCVLK